MLALYNFAPKFCPNCGRDPGVTTDRGTYYDYSLRATLTCECGLHFQRASTRNMVDAARKSEGDMDDVANGERDTHISVPRERSRLGAARRRTRHRT